MWWIGRRGVAASQSGQGADSTAAAHQPHADPDQANKRFVIGPNRPGLLPEWLANEDVDVSPAIGVNPRFGDGPFARVMPSFGNDLANCAGLIAHMKAKALSRIVWAGSVSDSKKAELVRADCQIVSQREGTLMMDGLCADEKCADDKYTDATMCQARSNQCATRRAAM